MLNAVENMKEYVCYEHRQLIRLLFFYNTGKKVQWIKHMLLEKKFDHFSHTIILNLFD